MNYVEMLEQPITTMTTPEGVIVCSRDLDQLPAVLQTINGRGLLLGRPKTYDRIEEKSPGLFLSDREGGPSLLLWRSVIPARRKYERAKSRNSRPILWPEVPGSDLLWDLLSEDKMRLLKFTLNTQQWFTNPEIRADGFAAYSATLVAFLGESI